MTVKTQATAYHYCSYCQTWATMRIITASAFIASFVVIVIAASPWARTFTATIQAVIAAA